MKKLFFISATIILLAGTTYSQDSEPGYRGWGPRVGLSLDPDQVHFGGHVDFGNFAKRLRFQPNLEIGFGDDLRLIALNFELNYRFSEEWDVWTPYLGGGLGVLLIEYDTEGLDDDSNTELGASILGGIEKGLSGGDRFFIEAKPGLVDAPDLKLTIGWTFG